MTTTGIEPREAAAASQAIEMSPSMPALAPNAPGTPERPLHAPQTLDTSPNSPTPNQLPPSQQPHQLQTFTFEQFPPPSPSASSTASNPTHRLQQVTEDVFADAMTKVGDFLKSEILVAAEDYRLIEGMNNLMRDKYIDMSSQAQQLITASAALQNTYQDVEPYIHQISEVEKQVLQLEQLASELDDYTKRLGKTIVGELATALGGSCEVIATILDESEREILEQFEKVNVLNTSDYLEPLDYVDDLEGVDEVVLVPSNRENKLIQAQNMIDACIEAKASIKNITLISLNPPPDTPSSSLAPELQILSEIETYLTDQLTDPSNGYTGTYTILRTNPFYHAILLYRPQIAREGVLPAPVGQGRVAMLDMDDISVAVRELVAMKEEERKKKHGGKTYSLTGGKSMSFTDMCQIMSKVTGKSIKYRDIPREEAAQILSKTELPPIEQATLLDEYDAIKAVKMDFVTEDYRTVTGYDPTKFEAWCEDHSLLLQRVEEEMEE
ncbi:hypothetical protein HK102_013700 [Quaeritorhiza haematococci]|nr:hypothetical protein HK102_013700 [Quaeritorhiza haematococci]